MIDTKTACLSFALHCLFPVLVSAQSLEVMTLGDVVSRFEEHRAQLLSYAAHVQVVEYSEDKYDDEVYRTVGLLDFEVLADLTRDSYLITRNSYRLSPQPRNIDGTRIFLKNGPRVFIGENREIVEKASFSDWDGFFDPQVLGMGFCAELGRFYEFEQVIGNYRRWHGGWRVERADGLVTFGTRRADGSYVERYCFSESQGFSPVLLEMTNVGLKVQCTYVEVDGI